MRIDLQGGFCLQVDPVLPGAFFQQTVPRITPVSVYLVRPVRWLDEPPGRKLTAKIPAGKEPRARPSRRIET
jgi:hypothetical protein